MYVCGVYNRRFEGAMVSLAVCSRVYACGEWWLMLSLERGVAVNSAVDGKIGKVGVRVDVLDNLVSELKCDLRRLYLRCRDGLQSTSD